MARKAKDAVAANSDQFQQEFQNRSGKGNPNVQQQFAARQNPDAARWTPPEGGGKNALNQMRAMETGATGFSLDKMSQDVKDQIGRHGLTMQNGTYHGKASVEFTVPPGSTLVVNGKPGNGSDGFRLDGDTASVKVFALKHDGFDNPNAPLRMEVKNVDGSTETIVINKPQNAANRPTETQDAFSAKGVDKYIANFSGDPKALLDSAGGKPYFDALVNNWGDVSDATVAKVKMMISQYARDNYGVNLPYDFKLTVATAKGQPALQIEGSKGAIFNDGGKTAQTRGSEPEYRTKG